MRGSLWWEMKVLLNKNGHCVTQACSSVSFHVLFFFYLSFLVSLFFLWCRIESFSNDNFVFHSPQIEAVSVFYLNAPFRNICLKSIDLSFDISREGNGGAFSAAHGCSPRSKAHGRTDSRRARTGISCASWLDWPDVKRKSPRGALHGTSHNSRPPPPLHISWPLILIGRQTQSCQSTSTPPGFYPSWHEKASEVSRLTLKWPLWGHFGI